MSEAAAEKAAEEYVKLLSYGKGQESYYKAAFIAGAEWGKQEERYMAEQRGRIDAMLDEIAIERVKAEILAGEKEGK